MRPKFGIHFEPLFGFDYKTIEKITLNAEKLGYDSVWTCDHFFKDPDSVTTNSLEAWTLLTALAAKTSEIQLGVLVTSNSYRHPSMLAKIASQYEHLFKMGFTHFQILFPYGKELEMSKQFAELVIRGISKT